MNKLVILFSFLLFSCTQERHDVDAYVQQEIQIRLESYINSEMQKCDERAQERASVLVDSLYKVNPIKFLSDTTKLPDRPIKPSYPEFD